MRLSMIVAAAEDNAIGKNNEMLWHLPDDFKFFKATTIGHPIIMGRKTMEALGKPLKNRTHLVISRNESLTIDGVTVLHSLEEAVQKAEELDDEEVFVIGGGQIYKQALPLADRVYLTRVHARFPDADAHFPELDPTEWKLTETQEHEADDRHKYAMTFQVFDRA